jgi:hypothetical protein
MDNEITIKTIKKIQKKNKYKKMNLFKKVLFNISIFSCTKWNWIICGIVCLLLYGIGGIFNMPIIFMFVILVPLYFGVFKCVGAGILKSKYMEKEKLINIFQEQDAIEQVL